MNLSPFPINTNFLEVIGQYEPEGVQIDVFFVVTRDAETAPSASHFVIWTLRIDLKHITAWNLYQLINKGDRGL